MSAVRDGQWKLVEWLEDATLELFDLKSDPFEKTNVAVKEPARVRTLHAMLTAWRAETGALLPTKNTSFDPRAKEAR